MDGGAGRGCSAGETLLVHFITSHILSQQQGQCTFGPRLSEDDITRLSAYVLAQAAGGWKG